MRNCKGLGQWGQEAQARLDTACKDTVASEVGVPDGCCFPQPLTHLGCEFPTSSERVGSALCAGVTVAWSTDERGERNSLQVEVVLAGAGVQAVEEMMRSFVDGGQASEMAAHPALSVQKVGGSLKALFRRVAMPGTLPEFERVTDPATR